MHSFVVPGSVASSTTKVGKRPRDSVVVPSDGHDEAETEEGTGDDLIEPFDKIMLTVRPGDRPAAWLRATQSPKGADFLSLFDGNNGSINSAASIFGLDGLPPVDLNVQYPVNV